MNTYGRRTARDRVALFICSKPFTVNKIFPQRIKKADTANLCGTFVSYILMQRSHKVKRRRGRLFDSPPKAMNTYGRRTARDRVALFTRLKLFTMNKIFP
ncbi:hypothetical protein PilKf_01118 [Pillotina sp. SPG140]